MEDPCVFIQGHTLDEIVENIREVADLLHGEKSVQIELMLPPPVKGGDGRRATRTTPRIRA